MGTKPALAVQADIERAVRALKACGHENVRVVLTRDGVVVEPAPAPAPAPLDTLRSTTAPERVFVI